MIACMNTLLARLSEQTLMHCQKSIALPDMHSGYGFAIGNVAAFDMDNPDAVVSPGGVGFDINCGVRLIRTNLVSSKVGTGGAIASSVLAVCAYMGVWKGRLWVSVGMWMTMCKDH